MTASLHHVEGTEMHSRRPLTTALLAVVALLTSACGNGSDESTSQVESAEPGDTTTTAPAGHQVDSGPPCEGTPLEDPGDQSLDDEDALVPYGLAVDGEGTIYFSLSNQIACIDPNGAMYVIAGSEEAGYSGDGGPASEALLADALGLALGEDGTLHIADNGNNVIRSIGPDGVIQTITGGGNQPPLGVDAVPAEELGEFDGIRGVGAGRDGTVYVTDTGLGLVLEIDGDGNATDISGTRAEYYPDEGEIADDPAAGAVVLSEPEVTRADPQGAAVIVDTENQRLLKVEEDGTFEVLAGALECCGVISEDGAQLNDEPLSYPNDMTWDAEGRLVIADTQNARVVRQMEDGSFETLAIDEYSPLITDGAPPVAPDSYEPSDESVPYDYGGSESQVPALTLNLGYPSGVAIDARGRLVIADSEGARIYRIDDKGSVETLFGGD
ncbi:MAG: hypothetical protein DCC48_05500 [Acidobacteria bacterium]|nr:MAG: hypothetical protein DCC48_05500 [Acidobacteriota bacterium]